jgi:hypothetical protein
MTDDVTLDLWRQIYIAVSNVTDDPDLLSILGSLGDTLTNSEVLAILKEYNAGGVTIHEIQ